LQRCHNRQAIFHLQECLRRRPHDPDALFLAARAARRARSYAESEKLLDRYRELRGLDDAVSLEQLLLTTERSVDRTAEQCWSRVEHYDPDTPLILEALARGYMRQYRLGQAHLCLKRWLELEPESAQAHYLEGLLQFDYAHARASAEESYRRALELDPEHEEARLGLAVTLINDKNFQEATEHLEYVRQRQPDNLIVQVGLAECREGLGKEEEAAQLLDGVLAVQPQLAIALAARGRIALDQGDLENAETYLRRAIAADPGDPRPRYNLVVVLNQSGKEDEARRCEKELKQVEEDHKRLNEIIMEDLVKRPRDPALHCAVGKLLLRGGQVEEGLRWLQSALSLDSQYAPAREALTEFQNKTRTESQEPASGK
jgi:tetratricopeptide (TPR) repeat protein